MDSIELEIVTLAHSVSQNNSYAVILKERNGRRRLPIIIGAFEAQAIEIALENMQISRPLTHDLFKNIFDEFGAELLSVVISELKDGIFKSILQCRLKDDLFQIDSRTSDAIALALRFHCPVFTTEQILDAAGIFIEEEITEAEEDDLVALDSQSGRLEELSVEQLEEKIEEMLSKENYEEAAKIRDIINRKKQ